MEITKITRSFSGCARGLGFLVNPARENLKLKCSNGSSRVDLYPAGSEGWKVSQRSKHSLFTLKRVSGFVMGGKSPRMSPAFQRSELSGPH